MFWLIDFFQFPMVIPRLKQLFHCSFHLHRPEDEWVWIDEKVLHRKVGCDCGRTFGYSSRKIK